MTEIQSKVSSSEIERIQFENMFFIHCSIAIIKITVKQFKLFASSADLDVRRICGFQIIKSSKRKNDKRLSDTGCQHLG